MLGRGFTGHEHLAMFGLINMNARLYDPVLGRFLSPDPYVQVLGFTQAFNRFSYCMNSPLCYVDENGEFWWIAAAAFIGGAINVATNWKNIDNFWQGVGYFGVGATAGAIGALTGGAALAVTGGLGGAAGGAIAGFVGGATSGFILGGGNTLMAGGSLYDAWSNGLTGAYTGAATGAVLGGIGGGFTSYLKGENVWSGRDIVTGRNAFSLKNTPINETVHHRPVGSNPNPISPKPKLPQSEIRDYSVTTYENSHVNPMMEGKGLMNRPLQIEGYDVRLASQNDLYHAFPRSFDEQIVKGGWLYGNSGNSTMMVAPGTVNGVNGIYTLGINTETGIIYHRAFYEWGGFMKIQISYDALLV